MNEQAWNEQPCFACMLRKLGRWALSIYGDEAEAVYIQAKLPGKKRKVRIGVPLSRVEQLTCKHEQRSA